MSNFDFAFVLTIGSNQLMRSYVPGSFLCEKIVDDNIYLKTRKLRFLFILYSLVVYMDSPNDSQVI